MNEPIQAAAIGDANALLLAGFRVVFWIDDTGERRCVAISSRATISASIPDKDWIVVEPRKPGAPV
jgi:hypothetical protein